MERVAIIGAGLMGHGLAQVFAAAGHTVAITDERAGARASVRARARANLERSGGDLAAAERIEPFATLEEAVAEADLVVEAVSEDLELKQAVFSRLTRATRGDTILATNTSVISIAAIARGSDDPGRVLGTHFWNPPHLIPLVEVIQTEATRPEVVEQTMAVLARAGKVPIHVKRDIPGFIGNRLQHALWREAIALVDAGVCDARSIDDVVKLSFGLRLSVLGPLENADLIGLDLTRAIHDYVLPHIDRTPHASPLLGRLIEQGDLGMETGRGLREWRPGEAQEVRDRLFDHLVAISRRDVAEEAR